MATEPCRIQSSLTAKKSGSEAAALQNGFSLRGRGFRLRHSKLARRMCRWTGREGSFLPAKRSLDKSIAARDWKCVRHGPDCTAEARVRRAERWKKRALG